jgi:4-amino-4-deoxy-L-arabinose transferase-like glycosyltransferase
MFNSGSPGITRLFGTELAGQWSWLFPLLVVGLIAAIWVNRKRLGGVRGQFLLLFGGWFVTGALVFSFAQGIFHTYYLVLLGPPVAAILGAGVASLWSAVRAGPWVARLLLPLALVLTAAWQMHVLQSYPAWAANLNGLLVGAWAAGVLLALAAVVMLALKQRATGGGQEDASDGYEAVLSKHRSMMTQRMASVVAVAAALALMGAPVVWSATTTLAAGNAAMPSAGPVASAGGFGGRGAFGGNFNPGNFGGGRGNFGPGNRGARDGVATGGLAQSGPGEIAGGDLISFLQTNNDGYLYLVAVSSANEASPLALETGLPVLAMGGFSGGDPAMTPAKLQEMVAGKQLRFVMGGGGGFGGGFGRGNSSTGVNAWLQTNCTLVNPALYGQQGGSQLYDCAAK